MAWGYPVSGPGNGLRPAGRSSHVEESHQRPEFQWAGSATRRAPPRRGAASRRVASRRCAGIAESLPAGRPPTARQQRYLRELAMQRGVSFVPPRSCFEASRLIDQLKRRAPDSVAVRRREIRAVQDDVARGGDAARVLEGVETTGYGSSAHWMHGSRS
jgi:hypothetical protein